METDIELLNHARMMDKDALVKIFDLYSAALYNYALRLCGDPLMADQIVGDVFAKLVDQFSSGHGPRAYLRSYLYEITYHQIIDEARYSKRRAPLEAAELPGQATHSGFSDPDNQIILKQILGAIQNELTNDQRHVVILRFLEGFSLRETAAIINKKAENVKVIQSRAIAKLREAVNTTRSGRSRHNST
jgi:RNA polymerase sigma-70 factor (ECF subfamily)